MRYVFKQTQTPKFSKMSQISNTINVCSASDANLINYLPTLMNSISKNTKKNINFYLLANKLTDEIKSYLLELNIPRISLKIIDMKESFSGIKLDLLKHTTISTMDRLFLPSILKDIRKIIYLDIDLIVNDDLSKLYKLKTSKRGIAAKTTLKKEFSRMDNLLKTWISKKDEIPKILEYCKNPRCSCFNAGVLLLDLDKLRKNNMEEIVINLINKFGINDQLALNIYANGEYAQLPKRWNIFVGQENPKLKSIIHWIGPKKPWNNNKVSLREYWIKYYSPFFKKDLKSNYKQIQNYP